MLNNLSGNRKQVPGVLSVLSDREFEVFQLIGEGLTTGEIGARLHISGKTVAVHSANVRQKLNLKSTAQLIRFAVQSEDFKTLDGP